MAVQAADGGREDRRPGLSMGAGSCRRRWRVTIRTGCLPTRLARVCTRWPQSGHTTWELASAQAVRSAQPEARQRCDRVALLRAGLPRVDLHAGGVALQLRVAHAAPEPR